MFFFKAYSISILLNMYVYIYISSNIWSIQQIFIFTYTEYTRVFPFLYNILFLWKCDINRRNFFFDERLLVSLVKELFPLYRIE